jgi:SAM-dependent methyltransferase
MRFLIERIDESDVRGLEVLEVGSQDVNGSPRTVIVPRGPKKYVGVDFAKGRGVDVVLDVKDLTTHFGVDWFDVVISTEMLEHAKDWRAAVEQMKAVVKQGGLLVITARGLGFPYHGYPHDYWRFTVDNFRKIFADMWIIHLERDPDPHSPGVFLKARKTGATGTVDLGEINVAPIGKSSCKQ